MRLDTLSILYLLMALNVIISVTAKVFLDETMNVNSMFSYFIISMALTSVISLAITIDLPN